MWFVVCDYSYPCYYDSIFYVVCQVYFYIFFWFICFCLYIAIIFYSSAYHDFLLASCMYISGIISGLFLCPFFPLHDMGGWLWYPPDRGRHPAGKSLLLPHPILSLPPPTPPKLKRSEKI